jgi:hypothetical protein
MCYIWAVCQSQWLFNIEWVCCMIKWKESDRSLCGTVVLMSTEHSTIMSLILAEYELAYRRHMSWLSCSSEGWDVQQSPVYVLCLIFQFSVALVEEVFGELLLICGLWSPRYSDFSLCTCLWGMLKGRVYMSSPHTLQELKDNIWREMSDISRQEPCFAVRGIFIRPM